MSQLAKIATFFSDAKDLRSRIAAASLLLTKTSEQKYFAYLFKIAQTPVKSGMEHVYDAEPEAISAIVSYAQSSKQKRKEVASLVRKQLGRIPMSAHADFSGMRPLVAYLGLVGEPSDVGILTKYCAHEDASLVVTAIDAIAKLNPDVALEKVRRQIDRYVKGKGQNLSFGWYVAEYLDLIFWQDDRAGDIAS